jgi:hypothetical protein
MRKLKFFLCPLVVAALLSQTACAQSDVTLTLGLVVSSATAFLDIADPSAAAVAGPYLTSVSNFVSFSTTELDSSDSAAVKADKIAQEALTLAKPNLPPGTATNVIEALAAVAAEVTAFLAAIKTTSAAVQALPSGAEAFAASGPKTLKMSRGDKQALPKIKASNDKLKTRIQNLRAPVPVTKSKP